MLLYSTKIPVKEELTKDEFVHLVIKWNQQSPHDKMSNVSWDQSSYNLKFQEAKRSLTIEELPVNNVIASRFRKEDENGIVWTSDFVLNLSDKILAVRLDREATEDTTNFIPRFSPPHLVKVVIRNNLSGMDENLMISSEAFSINIKNYKIIENVMLRKVKYALPIVYITKTWAGNYPLDVKKLSSRLQGVAHVLKESEPNVSRILMKSCNGENVHHGGIGIYYPNVSAADKKINVNKYIDKGEEALIQKIVATIFRYSNQQHFESMYTWEGVQNEILRLKNVSLLEKRQAVENENQELIDVFGEQLKEQETTIKELNNKITALTQENQGLRAKLGVMDDIPALFLGDEKELYEGEIRDILIDILKECLKNHKPNSRRSHILRDIIENNESDDIPEKKRIEIKRILKGYRNMTNSMKQDLQRFGFAITSDGKHYKLTYYNNSQYVVTMAKTSSDALAGNNLAAEIIRNML